MYMYIFGYVNVFPRSTVSYKNDKLEQTTGWEGA